MTDPRASFGDVQPGDHIDHIATWHNGRVETIDPDGITLDDGTHLPTAAYNDWWRAWPGSQP